MIVRILNDRANVDIGLYDSFTYTFSHDAEHNEDKSFNVSHWFVLPVHTAEELKQEIKKQSLDLKQNIESYGVYEMTEEDVVFVDITNIV